MKNSDFRINNIVSYQGNQCVIYNLLFRHASLQDDHGVVGYQREVDYSLIEGVPLTKDWMVRFQFKPRADGGWIHDQWNIIFYLDNRGREGANRIDYVHQLQNYFWGYTVGKELVLLKK